MTAHRTTALMTWNGRCVSKSMSYTVMHVVIAHVEHRASGGERRLIGLHEQELEHASLIALRTWQTMLQFPCMQGEQEMRSATA
jgi:hypothetical protein